MSSQQLSAALFIDFSQSQVCGRVQTPCSFCCLLQAVTHQTSGGAPSCYTSNRLPCRTCNIAQGSSSPTCDSPSWKASLQRESVCLVTTNCSCFCPTQQIQWRKGVPCDISVSGIVTGASVCIHGMHVIAVCKISSINIAATRQVSCQSLIKH